MRTILTIVIFASVIGCSNNKNSKHKRNYKYFSRYHQKYDAPPIAKKIPNLDKITNAIPKNEPKSRCGNPNKYTVFNKTYQVLKSSKGYRERGYASWYGTKFHGFRTSNGEVYNMYAMTAAHKTLPLPTYVKITNLNNKISIIVKCNDRGPFHGNRIIDLSYAAAKKLDILNQGTALVEVVAVNVGDQKSRKKRR